MANVLVDGTWAKKCHGSAPYLQDGVLYLLEALNDHNDNALFRNLQSV